MQHEAAEPLPQFVPEPLPGVRQALTVILREIAADPAGGLRFLGRTLWLAALTAWHVPLHLIWDALGRASPWPRRYLARVTRAIGIRVSIVGTPLDSDVFFVGNHLSWTDPLALGGVTGTAFIAQDRIRDWPLFGWLSRLNHTVFVSRTDRLAVGEQIAEIRTAIADLRMLGLFPEGTTTDGRSLLPFKAPLFAVMVPPPRPTLIQCVLFDFDDAGKDLAWIGVETAPRNAWRVLTRPGTYRLTLHFLEPFDAMALPGGRKAVSAECRRRLAGALSQSLGGIAVQ